MVFLGTSAARSVPQILESGGKQVFLGFRLTLGQRFFLGGGFGRLRGLFARSSPAEPLGVGDGHGVQGEEPCEP